MIVIKQMGELVISRYQPGELLPENIQMFIEKIHNEYFPELLLDYNVPSYSIKLASKSCAIVAHSNNDDALIVGGAFGYCNDFQEYKAYLSFFAKTIDAPKGLAHHLHLLFLQMAHDKGMKSIALEVRKSNEHAIDFYIRHGYVLQADHGIRNLMGMTIPDEL